MKDEFVELPVVVCVELWIRDLFFDCFVFTTKANRHKIFDISKVKLFIFS